MHPIIDAFAYNVIFIITSRAKLSYGLAELHREPLETTVAAFSTLKQHTRLSREMKTVRKSESK